MLKLRRIKVSVTIESYLIELQKKFSIHTSHASDLQWKTFGYLVNVEMVCVHIKEL